ncbi:ACP S-malonyltransferase [Streptacidiphilus melanogenes]|uniref:ACP S-malonyltransferase n=1 Tax=Streptacidiphilus melanogenes TaxID=411235 RepID=UPI000A6A97E6|nr:ACP S-malonyltransferase [Streptacidiphilus melanogenes]
MSRSLFRAVPAPRGAVELTLPADHALDAKNRARVAGFFPGLGSRSFYRNLDRTLLDCGVPEVAGIYREAARTLGVAGRPDLLLLASTAPRRGTLERQGFIGAALLVHGLVLDAWLRHRIAESGTPADVVAYTGESFGVLTAAVAGGALTVSDGVRIAHAFTPLMLLAAGGADSDEPFARDLARHLPPSVLGAPLVPEPCHVLALTAPGTEALEAVLAAIATRFPLTDVEPHKAYAPTQANLYVRAGFRARFDRFVAAFPEVTVGELKDPTVFLAHSARMRPARQALDAFLDANGIRFRQPRVPVVSNHDMSLLTTAADVRRGVLAMTDQVMASRETCETLNGLDLDLVLELGPGGKSLRLLRDNAVEVPFTEYTARREDDEHVLGAVTATGRALARLEHLYGRDEPLGDPDLELVRDLFRRAGRSAFAEEYTARALERVVTVQMLRPDRNGTHAFYRLLELLQHTWNHREHVDTAGGELVARARLKKRLTGADPERLGRAELELDVLTPSGRSAHRTARTTRPEVLVVHFDAPVGLDEDALADRIRLLQVEQPAAMRIRDALRRELGLEEDALPPQGLRMLYQYLLFDALQQHRPALFAQNEHYLAGGDPLGWLTALAVSGAAPLATVIGLFVDGPRPEALERMLDGLAEPQIPLVSPAGVPVQSRRDLAETTRGMLGDGPSHRWAHDGRARIHLGGNCQVISLGSRLTAAEVDAGPHHADLVRVGEPAEIWRRRRNPALDRLESACALALTQENAQVLETARSRRVLSSTVYAYIGIDESVVSFGKGGSESMTVFVRKQGEERVTVRKILSEALTTARWNPQGTGVMLPPFAKARKQAEYLRALPASVRPYFPEVFDVAEREVPVPPHRRRTGQAHGPAGGPAVDREVLYEMSYVAGEEVSRFVERHSPPPVLVARLYEQVVRVLNERVHSVGRVPAPGETLDVSYFRKIEDRLDLCRRTAPRTFGEHLLGTERIVVNGVSYLNSGALLRRFRGNPAYARVLEPRFHSLVMGDTNTENIKITDSGPLLRAQRLIESGAPREKVDAALTAVTAEALGIRFLDPRAIGFKSEGADTRDDAMYDNKPWHNSIGHYDEIHFEHFTLAVDAGEDRTPRVDVGFLEGNPYQRAYRVRDVTAKGGAVHPEAPQGMEDHFAPVMTAALGLDDPASPFLEQDPYWLVRFVFMMGQHFTAMPPFHFQQELDGTLVDDHRSQRRPVAIYCEGVKWLNWALEMLDGTRTEFLGLPVPALPHLRA